MLVTPGGFPDTLPGGLLAPGPPAGAAFDFDFTSGALPSGMTFARTSLAWSFNAAGLLISNAANTPRFDYDPISLQARGLLIEQSLANFLLWCRDLTQAPWINTNITAALTQTGIDGIANSASAITASAANGTVLQSTTGTLANRTFSAYVKRLAGSGVVSVTVDGGATWTPITVTSSWTRFSNVTQNVTNSTPGFQLSTSGDSIAVDFAQLEGQGFTSSPMLTTTTTFTRSVDTGFIASPSWFNNSAGTLLAYFDCGLVPNGINQGQVQLDDGGSNNRYLLRAQTTWDGLVQIAGTVVWQSNAPVVKVPGSGPVKDAIAYQAGNITAAAAGRLSSAPASSPATLPIGVNRFFMGTLNAWVRRVTYWPFALNPLQMIAATT